MEDLKDSKDKYMSFLGKMNEELNEGITKCPDCGKQYIGTGNCPYCKEEAEKKAKENESEKILCPRCGRKTLRFDVHKGKYECGKCHSEFFRDGTRVDSNYKKKQRA